MNIHQPEGRRNQRHQLSASDHSDEPVSENGETPTDYLRYAVTVGLLYLCICDDSDDDQLT